MHLDGILFFPPTPFRSAEGRHSGVDREAFVAHVLRGLEHRPGGVFAACGTGEYHAMDAVEYRDIVDATVQTVDREVPTFAGVGGPLPQACAAARTAADAGVDGLLILPPYLVTGPPDGVASYVEAIADATDLPVVAYQRSGARFTPATASRIARHPRVVGLKDGVGDLDRMHRLVVAIRGFDPDFLFFNGLPTAEITVPAYRGIGVHLYSSAVFAFVPEVATAFYRSLYDGDGTLARRLTADFFSPFVELRDLVPGYAVSLVKAGAGLRGENLGVVRPPLVAPSAEHLARLDAIIRDGLASAAAG